MFAELVRTFESLLELGGPVVMLLIGVSLISASAILYKLWQFWKEDVGCQSKLKSALMAWEKGEHKKARHIVDQSRGYTSEVLLIGMERRVHAARLEAEAETCFSRLERGFRLLDSIAQIAPLLGLFGTVIGMIDAFQALQQSGSQVDPSMLAGGIWVALLTTALGLAIAMPTSMILSWLESRIDADRVFLGRAIHILLSRPEQLAENMDLLTVPGETGDHEGRRFA